MNIHENAKFLLDAIEVYEACDPGETSYRYVKVQKARIDHCLKIWNKSVPEKNRIRITSTFRTGDDGVMSRLVCLLSYTTLGRREDDPRLDLERYVAELA